jgi:hypothetical protein
VVDVFALAYDLYTTSRRHFSQVLLLQFTKKRGGLIKVFHTSALFIPRINRGGACLCINRTTKQPSPFSKKLVVEKSLSSGIVEDTNRRCSDWGATKTVVESCLS